MINNNRKSKTKSTTNKTDILPVFVWIKRKTKLVFCHWKENFCCISNV